MPTQSKQASSNKIQTKRDEPASEQEAYHEAPQSADNTATVSGAIHPSGSSSGQTRIKKSKQIAESREIRGIEIRDTSPAVPRVTGEEDNVTCCSTGHCAHFAEPR